MRVYEKEIESKRVRKESQGERWRVRVLKERERERAWREGVRWRQEKLA